MRTFHIGGAASRRAEASTLEVRHAGTVKYLSVNVVKNRQKSWTVMNRNGEIAIIGDAGRQLERYTINYGARLRVGDGDKVEAGQLVAEWDPFATPILTEVGGVAKFGDLIEGTTVTEQVDDVTGMSRKVVVESKDPDLRPRISIKDAKGQTLKLPASENQARYLLPVSAVVNVGEGEEVHPGDVIAKMPRETTKTKDITGGLPRVTELFEARKPKDFAIISEISGVVSFGKDTKGMRKVIVTPEVEGELRPEMAKEYLIPKGKHVSVHEGDRVKVGEGLMDGSPNPHDILRVLGEKELQSYLVNEIQEVYRLQGVNINDKHIETIVRQMLRRVRIKDVGDADFLLDEQVEKAVFEDGNSKVKGHGKKPAVAEPLLLGITKASLSTESFISAASFQETTKVLTEAAITGKVDMLRGLKENVIMGRLIPAGTGVPRYSTAEIIVEGAEAEAAQEVAPVVAEAIEG